MNEENPRAKGDELLSEGRLRLENIIQGLKDIFYLDFHELSDEDREKLK